MNPRQKFRAASAFAAIVALAILCAAGYGLYAAGLSQGRSSGAGMRPPPAARDQPAGPALALPQTVPEGEAATRRHVQAGIQAGDLDPATGRRVLYYHDPMTPAQRFDKPGKSPFMDMMLVPVYAEAAAPAGAAASAAADGSSVSISPRMQQNLGVRTALVSEGRLSTPLQAVGSIAYNERDQAVVQARANGTVERLLVRATLDRVTPGQALAEVRLPDWIAAQEEFLAVRRMPGVDLAALVDASRQRMRQVGMNEAQIALVERQGQVQPHTTLVAPIGGVVSELLIREGMTVMSGATLFRINGLATVWAIAEVPESQLAGLRTGGRVQATSPALPGSRFEGRLQAILPEVNPGTRTVKARVELANPRGELLPGLFVQMQFAGQGQPLALLVPSEAVIQTGRRAVVVLAEANGHFRPVDVEVGAEAQGWTEIRHGLQVGQRVVVSSQFLVDAEASLKSVETRMQGPAAAPPVAASASAGGGRP
jgi:Cu(I)/Ag(I) efflux system membrane fusion protein